MMTYRLPSNKYRSKTDDVSHNFLEPESISEDFFRQVCKVMPNSAEISPQKGCQATSSATLDPRVARHGVSCSSQTDLATGAKLGEWRNYRFNH